MLPSGNDAAFSIAEHFGNILVEFKYSKCSPAVRDKVKSFYYGNKHVMRFFLKEMNLHAKELGMNDSYFDSPHGLMNRFNQSTVNDMAKLTHACMQIPLFRTVVAVHKLETRARVSKDQKLTRYRWTNTNKLLGNRRNLENKQLEAICEGVKGCKTGITQSAGPCFSGYFERNLILENES